ncbi:hypothetical protein HOU08_gp252 [Dickeya phage vB_DsoM_JA29]|uniref:Channel forming colicins domain-containing protein n=1 Tax=Dickeya phage vB_DsoM_JA29 TaxID=2283031 RepID=A0A384ZXJ7_9CAUD|nr:hypothetical protein HOU08_gp252 [Dickeya phage vB_DsoM_JA29]AXG66978.1 hypothetical protein JA29_252 [Dickeya phage vB_DsoM_JA29]
MTFPTRGKTYTFEQLNDMELRDSPFLRFRTKNINGEDVIAVIQTSHVTDEQLASIPGFSESLWTFQYETDEWIPLFMFAEKSPIEDLVDCEEAIDPYRWEEVGVYATPKGFPCEQYYYRDEHGVIRRRHDGKRHDEY